MLMPWQKMSIACTILLLLLAATGPCPAAEDNVLMMATTTSTNDTGLLDYLAPHFQKSSGLELRWTAVGTGKALKLGESCDVDVLLVHDPEAEQKYIAAGTGIERREVMFNDFVFIGPAADPAKIQGRSAAAALAAVAKTGAIFVSRGDNSGTHAMERALWSAAGGPLPDKESWYVQTGQGMLPTIAMAAERRGYTLTDRGTFIKYADTQGGKPPLIVLAEGDAALRNQYSVILVNPQKCPKARTVQARKFSDWLAGAGGQKLIAEFRLLGQPLFTPNAR